MSSSLTNTDRGDACMPTTSNPEEGVVSKVNSGIVEHASPLSFDATLDRLTETIGRAGLTVFARIDHAAGAQGAGLEMPPTVVLIYGDAKGGTPIMLAAPQAALDLPLRVLVREDTDGRTSVAFHPITPVMLVAGVSETLASRLEPAQVLLIKEIQS